MPSDISLLNVTSELARHSAARHNVIARNVANADSPNYKAQDIKEFSLDDSNFVMRTTKAGHVSTTGISKGSTYAEHVVTGAAVEPNGNSVSLEDQMVRSIEAQGAHNKAMAIYQKSVDLLRLSIGRR